MAQMEKMLDLAWSIDGDRITLEQDAGFGESVSLELHPLHVRMLATELGMFNGDREAAARVQTLERRLRVLLDRIANLDERLWSVPTYPLGKNSEDADCIYSDATLDIAKEFCADCANADGNAEVTLGALPMPAGVARDCAVTPHKANGQLDLEAR